MENHQERPTSTATGYPVRDQSRVLYVQVDTEEENPINTTTMYNSRNIINDGERPITANEFCFALVGAFIVITVWLVCDALSTSHAAENLIFSVDSVNFKSLNLSPQSNITSDWKLKLSAINPDEERTVFFDIVKVSLLYKGVLLSSNQTKSFYLGSMDSSSITTSFGPSSLHVDNWAKTAIADEWLTKDSVSFNVEVQALVKLNPGAENEKYGWVFVGCNNVHVTKSSIGLDSMLSPGSKWCSVYVHKHQKEDMKQESENLYI